jgi:geranylgeranyl reductase family protein
VSSADVVVVGAGPAGSLAAARLALLGRSVVLLEAAGFPRDKVCGDVLLPEVDRSLAEVETSFEAIAPEAHRLDGCRYQAAGGRRMEGIFRDARGGARPWRILPRRTLDARLAAHAVGCGAELRERHRLVALSWQGERRTSQLQIDTPRGLETLEARVVIGADGASSRVARESGLRPAASDDGRHLFVGMRAYADWPADDSYVTVIADRELVPGCSWIVPEPGGRANIGVGMIEADRRARGVRLRRRLEELLRCHADLGTVRDVEGWLLPGGHGGRRTVADGVMLVGDAAGLIDPFTGHGIQNAMRSGLDAAVLADRAIAAGDPTAAGPIGGFERMWRRRMLTEFRLGRLLQRFHARPALVGLAVARAAASRRWADRFMGLIGHAVAKTEILRPGFLFDFVRPAGDWPRR